MAEGEAVLGRRGEAAPSRAPGAPEPDAVESPSTHPGRRNLQLDVLRGVAILLVIGRHLELDEPSGPLGPLAWTWHRIGWIGVDLFFVLSGFLIGGLLLGELRRHGRLDVGRFLIRRGLKLYPPYYLFIGALILLPVARTALRGGDALGRLGENLSDYWPNLLFLHTYVGVSPAGHTWSLATEEHFYLLLPFALLGLAALGKVRWVVAGALAAVPLCLLARLVSIWTDNRYADGMSATHLRLDALLFGVALRAVAQYWPERFAAFRRYRVPLFFAGVALWLPNLVVDPESAVIRSVGLTATFVGAAAFLLASFHTTAADFGRLAGAARAGARALAGIGVYSYAIYLWHVSVIGWARNRTAGRFLDAAGGWNSLAWLATAVVATLASIAFGVVFSKLVDWPVLRFRDRFFPSRSASLPAGGAPAEVVAP